MQQYFINITTCTGDLIIFNKEQAHHISHVLRMKNEDIVRIVDASSHLYHASVQFVNDEVCAKVLEQLSDTTLNKVEITLAQGLIKGEKWDYLLQKSAELGVTRILPFTSSRTVVKTKDEKQDKKMARWNKILQEACEQCKRSTLVDLHTTLTIQQVATMKSQLNIIAYEDADQESEWLGDILKLHPNVMSITLVIGPEGGFSSEEVCFLEQQGFLRVSLGTRILRAETAALSTISNCAFYYEMVGK